jgi:hypothetical protein
MARITFTDKEDSITNPAPAINKVVAADMNEIKTSVNSIYDTIGLQDNIVVNQANVATTLGGVIDSTKQYFIDGIIDLGAISITVPPTGMTLAGYSFDISGLTSSENNYTMFVSAGTGGGTGSGNLLGENFYISVTGTGSRVYNLYDDTGFNAIEFVRINYND